MPRGALLFISCLLAGLIFLTFINNTALADSPTVPDISWPNCKLNLPALSSIGIVGVNGGLDYSKNPCLAAEAQFFHNTYALYLNTGYPGVSYGLKFADYPKDCQASNSLCLAYNYGYNDALYSVKYADAENVHSFVWWLDIETENSWTSSYKQNRESLIGMVAALNKELFRPIIGYYSYPGQWAQLTKKWDNGYPAWVATGLTTKSAAKDYCGDSFNSGPVWLAQYSSFVDSNYVCRPTAINSFKIRSF